MKRKLPTCHVLVVDKYRLDGSAFAHYMVVKFVHNVRSTVHERVCLVLWIVSHSVACKAAHAVLVDRMSRPDRVYASRFVAKFRNALFRFFGIWISHLLRKMSLTLGYVLFSGSFL